MKTLMGGKEGGCGVGAKCMKHLKRLILSIAKIEDCSFSSAIHVDGSICTA